MKLLIHFYANVSDITVNELIKQISIFKNQGFQKEDPLDEIIIQISSSGGSSDHGLLAYNFLTQVGVPITTIGMGNVDSAAIMIYCAGTKRISLTSCRFLIHEATATIQGVYHFTKLKELKDIVETINNQYCAVISKISGKSLPSVKSRVTHSTVMSPQQAKEYGLVTLIDDRPYLKDQRGVQIIGINNVTQIQNARPIAQV